MNTTDVRFEILEQKKIAPDIYQLLVSKGYQNFQPGQFVQVEVSETLEPFLRRPISICDANQNALKLIYKVVGKGTKLLSQNKVGDKLRIFGPLGQGFVYSDIKEATIVGGGIGVPPLLGLAKAMYQQGTKVEILLGFNTESQAILVDEFKKYGRVHIATLDGSLGHRGLVTDLIKDQGKTIFACGPEPLYHTLEKYNLKGYYSLERRMACGVGVCLGCNINVTKDGKTARRRVCHDGPVFPIGSVIWGERLD
ncbi:MAG: dihydroorotate dehydrogenase electron transfer subunit [Firmicutes bacterium]|nr:dihydroorotate dehydrogenase electron transfer subunit [Bacillota bacterium]